MMRRRGGLVALPIALFVGCGGGQRADEAPRAASAATHHVNARAPEDGALSATRLGLAAWRRMLDDAELQATGDLPTEPRAPAHPPPPVGDGGFALEGLWQNVLEAHRSAAYSDEQLSFAAHAGAATVEQLAERLSEEEAALALAGVEPVRARLVADCVERRFARLTQRTELREQLRRAGARLVADVEAAALRGGDVAGHVDEAWARYASRTDALLGAALAAHGVAVTAAKERVSDWISWEAESVSLSARDEEGAASLEGIVTSLSAFYASVSSKAAAGPLCDAGLPPAKVDAALAILANLYASAV